MISNTSQGKGKGVTKLLVGHTDTVNVVKFLETSNGILLITGSVDKTIKIWTRTEGTFTCQQTLTEHKGSINCIAVSSGSDIFVSGAADGTFNVWKLESSTATLLQTVNIKPRFFPLALALSPLQGAPGDRKSVGRERVF